MARLFGFLRARGAAASTLELHAKSALAVVHFLQSAALGADQEGLARLELWCAMGKLSLSLDCIHVLEVKLETCLEYLVNEPAAQLPQLMDLPAASPRATVHNACAHMVLVVEWRKVGKVSLSYVEQQQEEQNMLCKAKGIYNRGLCKAIS